MRQVCSLSGTFPRRPLVPTSKECEMISIDGGAPRRCRRRKVGAGLARQAAGRWMFGRRSCNSWATKTIQETKLMSMGVVRAMTRSDHWRWVSTPRWPRTSGLVTPSCQREPLHNLHRTYCPVGAEDNLSPVNSDLSSPWPVFPLRDPGWFPQPHGGDGRIYG